MPTEILRDDVQRLAREGAQIVEVLPLGQYREAHLPGAIQIPLNKLEHEAPAKLRPDRPVVVYCFDFA